jgi:hypothetical protein
MEGKDLVVGGMMYMEGNVLLEKEKLCAMITIIDKSCRGGGGGGGTSHSNERV